jgi:hypothetical protein
MAIWNILWTLGIFYDYLVHFVFILCIFPVLVACTKKNLATLQQPQIANAPQRNFNAANAYQLVYIMYTHTRYALSQTSWPPYA